MAEAMLLFMLVVKHALADLVLQSRLTSGDKSNLKSSKGYIHAGDHGLLTFVVLLFFTSFQNSVVIAMLDYVLHFFIDYIKTICVRRFGVVPNTRTFWIVQGFDQIAHYSCYFLYVLLLTNLL